MYNLVRWAIILLLVGFSIWLKRKWFSNKKLFYPVCIIVAIICLVQLNMPFENYLYSFPSIEKVFKYYESSKDVIVLGTCIGEESGMLIYKDGDTYAKYIAPKTDDGWKIGNRNTYSIECEKNIDKYRTVVYKVSNSEDRYVRITASFVDDSAEITDRNGKRFESVKHGSHVSYYFYTNEDFDYTVVIDGVTFSLKD